MHLTRRFVVAGLGAAMAAPRAAFAIGTEPEARWLAAVEVDGGHAALAFGDAENIATLARSAVRLHAFEPSPSGPLAVAVARRPGTTAIVIDRPRRQAVGAFDAAPGCVFSGHGRFTADGARFLTTEIDQRDGGGRVTLRDVAAGFAPLAAWPTGGTGPHDLLLSGDSLVVANGGIEPGSREAAGAEDALASLAVLDLRSGMARARLELLGDLKGQSLRHLASGRGGVTVVAAQELAADGIGRPLVYRVVQDRLVGFEAPEATLAGLRGYVGSVAVDRGGDFVAAASPRGGRIVVWRIDGRFVGEVPLRDGCGLAATREPGRFVATSGFGEVLMLAASDDGVGVIRRSAGGPRFDNHIAADF